jgi:hypothetical protein
MSDAPVPARPIPVPKRWGLWLNLLIQLGVILFAVVAVNVLSARRYWRWDWSSSESFTLSGSTMSYLRKLAREAHITVLVPRASKLYADLQALTEEYRRNGKERIKVDFIDPVLDLDQAEKLKLDYGLRLDQSGVLVRASGRQRFLSEDELVVLGQGEDKDHPSIEFRGEDALTTALVTLIDAAPRKIYVLTGKGGDAEDKVNAQLAAIAELGRQLGFEAAVLDLSGASSIPKDATGLILCGAHYDLTEREAALLSDYWQQKRASMLVLLDPTGETPRLNSFLNSIGIRPRRDRVLYAESTSTGPRVEFTVHGGFSAESAITKHLSAATATFTKQTESLELKDKDETLAANGTKLQVLMTAAQRYWGESGYVAVKADQPQTLPVVDASDTAAPVPLAASVERGSVQDERMRVESARMVVIGNDSLLDKETRLAVNQDFLGASLSWMVGRERLIGIMPKRKEMYRIQLSDQERKILFWATSFVGPAAVLLLGLLIWAHRRAS